MKMFIDDHCDDHGVESICKVLPPEPLGAPSTYYTYAAIIRDPDLASDRAKRDARLRPEIKRVWDDNYKVYGVCKVWRQMQREGFDIARYTAARLMKQLGLQGVITGKPHKTTYSNKYAPCPRDHVNRQFSAPAPNMLWVSDFTFVSTRQGFAYVVFIIDVFAKPDPGRIVGWRVSGSAKTYFVLDALKQALYDRRPVQQDGLIHHSDRGVQGRFNPLHRAAGRNWHLNLLSAVLVIHMTTP